MGTIRASSKEELRNYRSGESILELFSENSDEELKKRFSQRDLEVLYFRVTGFSLVGSYFSKSECIGKVRRFIRDNKEP